jgi:DNA-binding FadR family transcriptional regulator
MKMENKSTDLVFAPATTRRASEVIYDQIYQKIISGELRPGDHLPAERIMAEQFRRSRPSIREALRMLQQDGLVKIEVGSAGGAIIQGISMESVEAPLKKLVDSGVISVRELAEYRSINDLGCARLAALNHTETDVSNLQRIIEEYRKAVDDSPRLREADTEFHYILSHASHNPMVIAINNVITNIMISMFWGLAHETAPENVIEINRKAYETHKVLVEAILERNPDKAEKCMGYIVDLFYESIQSIC